MPNYCKIFIVFLLQCGCYAQQRAELEPQEQLPTQALAAIESSDSHWQQPELREVSLQRASLSNRPADSPQDQAPLSASELGKHWFYGQGLGTSILNVGTSIAFPPYAIYLIGNAGLDIAGLPTLYATNALPKKPRSFVLKFYDGFTSIPGRFAALIAGEEFQVGRLSPSDASKIVKHYATPKDKP